MFNFFGNEYTRGFNAGLNDGNLDKFYGTTMASDACSNVPSTGYMRGYQAGYEQGHRDVATRVFDKSDRMENIYIESTLSDTGDYNTIEEEYDYEA